MKELLEKRNALLDEMEEIMNKAKTETRALNEEEEKRYDEIEKEIANLDKTIEKEEKRSKLEKKNFVPQKDEKIEVIEERSFVNYIKMKCGVPIETRAGEQNFTMTNNGAVIPTTIANRVISTVKEMCPILAGATIFNVKGTLKIPVYGLANTTHDIAVAYSSEFTELTADAGKFTSIDLTGYLVGALTLIGQSVVNNSDIDIANYIIQEMAKKIALFIEKELLNGTDSYATGALSTTTNLLGGSTSAITADNLIDLQAKIPTVYQANACWTMKTATFTAIRKLKDSNNQYLLQPSLNAATPYVLLGKPVYLSDNMPAIGDGNKPILYGDYSGLAINFREGISLQVLQEKYATQHAVGLVSWFEFDSKVIDNQKLATLETSAIV